MHELKLQKMSETEDVSHVVDGKSKPGGPSKSSHGRLIN